MAKFFVTEEELNTDIINITAFADGDDANAFADAIRFKTVYAQETLENLEPSKLLKIFNAVSKTEVKRFADKKSALKRTLAILDTLPVNYASKADKDHAEAQEPEINVNPGLSEEAAAREWSDAEPVLPLNAPPALAADLEKVAERLEATPAKEVVKTAKTKAPKKEKQADLPGVPAAPRKSRNKGINLKPLNTVYPARAGSKQAALIDLLSRGCGATMSVLKDALGTKGKPWTEASVKTGLNWDVHTVKGYGVRTEFLNGEQLYMSGFYDDATSLGYNVPDAHPDEVTPEALEAARSNGFDPEARLDVYFLVLPEGLKDVPPHKPVGAKPKAEKATAPAA